MGDAGEGVVDVRGRSKRVVGAEGAYLTVLISERIYWHGQLTDILDLPQSTIRGHAGQKLFLRRLYTLTRDEAAKVRRALDKRAPVGASDFRAPAVSRR